MFVRHQSRGALTPESAAPAQVARDVMPTPPAASAGAPAPAVTSENRARTEPGPALSGGMEVRERPSDSAFKVLDSPASAAPRPVPPPPPPPAKFPAPMAAPSAPLTPLDGVDKLPLQGRNYVQLVPERAVPAGPSQFHGNMGAAAAPQSASAAVSKAPPAGSAGMAGVAGMAAQPRPAAQAPITLNEDASLGAVIDLRHVNALPELNPAAGMSPLPSRRRAVSAVHRGVMVVALDDAGAVFTSRDSGRKWKAVATPWAGRAVQLADASFAVPQRFPQQAMQQGNQTAAAQQGDAQQGYTQQGYTQQPAPQQTLGRQAAPQAKAAGQGAANGVTGTIMGKVTDATGATISGAAITLQASGGSTQKTVADAAGRFEVGGLPAGTYQVRADAPGFQTYVATDIAVSASQPRVLDIRLTVGNVSQTIEVSAAATDINVETADSGAARKSRARGESGSGEVRRSSKTRAACGVCHHHRRGSALDQRRRPALDPGTVILPQSSRRIAALEKISAACRKVVRNQRSPFQTSHMSSPSGDPRCPARPHLSAIRSRALRSSAAPASRWLWYLCWPRPARAFCTSVWKPSAPRQRGVASCNCVCRITPGAVARVA